MPSQDVKKFLREFKTYPKDIQKKARPMLRASASEPQSQAKRNASWSDRIPQAIKVGLRFNKRFAGVTLYVNRKKARHARPFEKQGRKGTFRHRVFGQNVWVTQQSRPFFFQVAPEWHKDVEEKLGEVVDEVSKMHGFK